MTPLNRLLDQFLPAHEHSAARRFLVSGAVWFCAGTLWGLIGAMHLAAPDFFRGIPWLEFGRIRPAHTTIVLLGFVTSALIGATLYILPVVLRTKLYGERVANLGMWVWNLAMLSGCISLPLGYTQGREYAELVFPIDCLVVIAFLCLTYSLVMTVATRHENVLYVSVWYGLGGVLWTAVLWVPGNVMWRPPGGAMIGIVDAVWLWWYGHNIFGLATTPMAVAVAYYIIPRIARKPLYSHTLSLIGFWTLLALYTHIGAHHLLQAPVPTWLKTVSVIDSVAMVVPVATVLVNLWLTMRGALREFADSWPGKLIFAGSIWYLITCIQGPLQSLPSVQRHTHFNNWVIGHAHIAVLGFAGMTALGGLWYVLPLVARRKVYSQPLIGLQYWLVLIGVAGFFVVLTAAGLIQGEVWNNGGTVYRTLPMIAPYLMARAMFGMLIIGGAFIGLYNVVMTLVRGEPHES
ncbi:MAG: cytochrome-c oxidase [Armatimonadetes bacterium]|nr:cytochrome-c oxidase [Armatimonadota bacterium]